MKKIVLILIFTIGIFSCSSDDEVIIENGDLIGKWNWTTTDGGISGQIHETPTTTGKTIELNLLGQFNYTIVENEIEVSSGTYELSMEESIHSEEMVRFITYSNNYENQDIILSGIITVQEEINLNISDNIVDGLISSFEKIE